MRQYLYFFASKASKMSTWRLELQRSVRGDEAVGTEPVEFLGAVEEEDDSSRQCPHATCKQASDF